jgi:hypothetical protein
MSLTWLTTGSWLTRSKNADSRYLVELAGQRGGQVEPEAVDVHLGDPVAQRVEDQPQRAEVA